ncbi:nuclear receptor-interacting protein 2 [Triplophysa rosa]|uniref:Nuclear receptor-interacting protein 2 n=1 Tax=Triplophysa rosa TaxID=992332 RepID=A0A9W7W901_TRIRA|nr:nuclear receptor-interacting protein 2 [Triplophysa rosa]KAI7791897.1 nuclear receptor-interacting protein 2 [Triplophysa rosa]
MSGGKKELEMRDKAIMHQQRRLKQATQFTHKDSADLLPLDGLKRLGTSKDLQPHSIVQRRLLEGNIPRLRGEARDTPSHIRSPLVDSKEGGEPEERSESTVDDSTEERESPEESEKSLRSDEDEDYEEDRKKVGESASNLSALVVQCKCGDAEVKLSINTGCQHNHISKTCCRRLGLITSHEEKPHGKLPFTESTVETVKSLHLQLGREKVQCTAQVIEDATFEVCLGLQTLLELKCCVDLNSRVLRLHSTEQALPFLDSPACSQCHHHDNNKNM